MKQMRSAECGVREVGQNHGLAESPNNNTIEFCGLPHVVVRAILRVVMTKDAIREYLQATPFRPFTVRLTDGRPCEVPAQDFAHLSPNGRTLVVFTAGGDGVRVLDVALITELEAPAMEADDNQKLPRK